MLEKLKQEVYKANMEIVEKNIVIYTWGNASGIDREKGLVVIKPSGVDYVTMQPDDMVVVDMEGNVVEGSLKPSTDLLTHLELYRAYDEIKGVVHTHSKYAVSYAQASKNILPYGTTHADTFHGTVLCTRKLTDDEILGDYERNTGKVMIETLDYYMQLHTKHNIMDTPAILVNAHGPFTWGNSPMEAAKNSVVLETVAEIAYNTIQLCPDNEKISNAILDKHYFRKHGKDAYYGN